MKLKRYFFYNELRDGLDFFCVFNAKENSQTYSNYNFDHELLFLRLVNTNIDLEN